MPKDPYFSIWNDNYCTHFNKKKVTVHKFFSADEPNQEDMFCDPCLYADIKIKATHYCKTCDDPEPLCNDCARQHTRQKLSRHHEICDNIGEFDNNKKDSNPK